MKRILLFTVLLSGSLLAAQNVDYTSSITGFHGDCPDHNAREEYSWKGWLCDDVDLSEDFSGNIGLNAYSAVNYATSCLTRTRTNIASTKIISRFDGWEDDRGNRFTFDSDNNPRTNDDDCRVQKTSYFSITDANEHTPKRRAYACGTSYMNMSVAFTYQYATTSLSAATGSNEVFTGSGDLPFWGAQGAWGYSNDNTAASGSISNNETSSFSTTVSCKTEVSFKWRASSEFGYDFLEVYVNGNREGQISGNTSWQSVTLPLSRGSNTIEWRYTKDGSVSRYLDRGFVDNIEFSTNGQIYAGSIDGAQTVCSGETPDALGTVNYTTTLYDGLTHQWQKRVSGNWVDLMNENQEFLNFTAPLLETTTYRKQVSDSCGNSNYSNEIVVELNSGNQADFNYNSYSFYPEDITALPQFAAGSTSNGTFTGDQGLVIDTQTGIIDIAASTVGPHVISYTTNGTCSDTDTTTINIEKDFVYDNGSWSPNPPDDITYPSTRNHSILIKEDITYVQPLVAKNITIDVQANVVFNAQVDVYGKLDNQGRMLSNDVFKAVNTPAGLVWNSNKTTLETLQLENAYVQMSGDFIINSSIYNDDAVSTATIDASNAEIFFKSTATKTAVIDGANLTVLGEVNVEQYQLNKRAFRFITSSVNASTTIFENWQENGDDNIVNFGTHVTGSGGAANGFDISSSNAPSMFAYDNLTQTWLTKTSTNNSSTDILIAGEPYRMMIRGDRQTSLTTNATGAETVLRTKGTLVNGSFSNTVAAQNAGEFTFVGNPYQSNLDLKQQMDDLANGTSTDLTAIESNFYYVWDIRGNSNGVYRTYDRMTNSFVGANVPNSQMTPGIIAPGQAFFVAASGTAGGNLTLNRSTNDVSGTQSRNTTMSQPATLIVSLLNAAVSTTNASLDGFMVRFESNANNAVDSNDAVKFGNIDENISRMHTDGTTLSIESRDIPVDGEELQIEVNRYRNVNYALEINLSGLNGVQAVLVDNFLTTRTLLNNGASLHSFSVDASQAASTASDRFKIVFENVTLGVGDDVVENESLKLYPNPVSGAYFTVDFGSITGVDSVTIFNTMGQVVYTSNEVKGAQKIEIETASLSSGTYIVQISNKDQRFSEKLIVE